MRLLCLWPPRVQLRQWCLRCPPSGHRLPLLRDTDPTVHDAVTTATMNPAIPFQYMILIGCAHSIHVPTIVLSLHTHFSSIRISLPWLTLLVPIALDGITFFLAFIPWSLAYVFGGFLQFSISLRMAAWTFVNSDSPLCFFVGC